MKALAVTSRMQWTLRKALRDHPWGWSIADQRRVVIIVQNLPVPMDRRVWMECLALTAAGFTVSVICPKGPGDPSYALQRGVHVYKYAPPPPASGVLSYLYEFVYCWMRAAGMLVRIARRTGFDAIQACNPPDTYFALAGPLRAFGKKFVYDQHDLCPEVYISRFKAPSRLLLAGLTALERATYRLADHVIVTNESFRDIAVSRGHRLSGDVTVVRSGPRAELMRPSAPEPGLKRGRRFLCCYLGIMGPQDGMELLLQAVHLLVHRRGRSDISFALLGFGDCYDDLVQLTGNLNLGHVVEFTGRANDEMITRYLSTADVGLAPDPRNAMNELSTTNKVIEYMAFGLPVVSFDLREARISAGDAGIYAEANSVEAFADAIEILLADEDRRHCMGRAGRQRVEDVLAWEHQASRYVNVYERLLSGAFGRGK